MNKIIIGIVFGVAFASANLAIAAQPAQGMGAMHAMTHANPAPNLMRVIKQHGSELGLSESQAKELTIWREAHNGPMHDMVQEVVKHEKELYHASMSGEPKARIMAINARIMELRTQIVSTKTDCRDNMKRILTPEQFQKVLALAAGEG
ncbi:MAG: Spy/CpxP family protein refolding chaperone [Chromatiales bacterium]|nr:Spy/CpxP family protein refolding chaperone [Chromatiales bacterium]